MRSRHVNYAASFHGQVGIKAGHRHRRSDGLIKTRPPRKKRTASPSPTEPKPAALVAVAPGEVQKSALRPAFLLQVDGETMDWLEVRRRELGFRSRSEVIRSILTAARKGGAA